MKTMEHITNADKNEISDVLINIVYTPSCKFNLNAECMLLNYTQHIILDIHDEIKIINYQSALIYILSSSKLVSSRILLN